LGGGADVRVEDVDVVREERPVIDEGYDGVLTVVGSTRGLELEA
jgi:hypothetical protein